MIKRCRFLVMITFGLLFFAAPSVLFAHGTGYSQSDKPAVALDFIFSTDEPMSYMEFKVFSPSDSKVAYQTGRTDDEGRMAFVPSHEGEWRVVVADEEGHREEAKVPITQEFFKDGAGQAPIVEGKAAVASGLDLQIRSGLGVSLLFNIAAFVLLCKRKGA